MSLPILGLEAGDVITATATSPGGDTSEFSECQILEIESPPLPDAIFKNRFE